MSVIDGQDLDKALAKKLGPHAARLLGIDEPKELKRHAPDWMRIARHRVLALFASLQVVELARAAQLPNALIFEGDVRPVPSTALTADDISALRAYLAREEWQIVRPSGYFFDFAQYRLRQQKGRACPDQCQCETPVGLRRACVVRRSSSHSLHDRCDVRDTVGFAASRATFPAFHKLRRTALEAFSEMANAAAASQPSLLQPINASFGWPAGPFNRLLPWFDKWLPARFDALYILPSIAVQQVRQGDVDTSRQFAKKCQAKASAWSGTAAARATPRLATRCGRTEKVVLRGDQPYYRCAQFVHGE